MEQQDAPAQPSSPAAPVLTLLCWPLLAAQFWLTITGKLIASRRPETDREGTEGQLPVPDPIQDSMDSEIFA